MRHAVRTRRWGVRVALMSAALSFSFSAATFGMPDGKPTDDGSPLVAKTESPIKHVIILIGENRGTDHTFGVYRPKAKHQTISNLLSKGIVLQDGSPGPNFSLAQQFLVAPQPLYYVGAPDHDKAAYGDLGQMPQPNTNGAPPAQSLSSAPFPPAFVAEVAVLDPSPDFGADTDTILTTGFTGLAADSLDTRIPGAGMLPNGPFVLQGANISDDDYTGDMTHRFYQAWQQSDCSVANATKAQSHGMPQRFISLRDGNLRAQRQRDSRRPGQLQRRQ